jgi:hypothetical protein
VKKLIVGCEVGTFDSSTDDKRKSFKDGHAYNGDTLFKDQCKGRALVAMEMLKDVAMRNLC